MPLRSDLLRVRTGVDPQVRVASRRSAHSVAPCSVRTLDALHLHGQAPALDRLDASGNLPFAVDFRSYYATLLERHWDMDSSRVLGAQYPTLKFL